jgi:hypothetical protein
MVATTDDIPVYRIVMWVLWNRINVWCGAFREWGRELWDFYLIYEHVLRQFLTDERSMFMHDCEKVQARHSTTKERLSGWGTVYLGNEVFNSSASKAGWWQFDHDHYFLGSGDRVLAFHWQIGRPCNRIECEYPEEGNVQSIQPGL